MINKITLLILSFFDFLYQKKIISFLKKQKIPINTVIDVGAHKGETIKLLLQNLNPKKIISFEASRINFDVIKKKIDILKRKFPNTKLILENKALGSIGGYKKFKQMTESSSSTFASINLDSNYLKKKKFFLGINKNEELFDLVTIKMTTLSDYLKNNDLREIDLLKIDTEGFEFEILKGASEDLINFKLIFFEHHYDNMIKKGYTFTDVNRLLQSKKFKLVFKAKMPFRKTFEYIYQNQSQVKH